MANPTNLDYWRQGELPRPTSGKAASTGTLDYWSRGELLPIVATGTAAAGAGTAILWPGGVWSA